MILDLEEQYAIYKTPIAHTETLYAATNVHRRFEHVLGEGGFYYPIDIYSITLNWTIKYVYNTYEKTTDTLDKTHHYFTASFSGSMQGAWGQIQDSLSSIDDPLLNQWVRLWNMWHLNELTAGTRLQTVYLKRNNIRGYDNAVEALEDANLYVAGSYKYGSLWLVRPLPANLLDTLQTLETQMRKATVARRRRK